MPQLGETVAEGKITTWFKSVGDEIRPGDNLFEVETDKVTVEVPAISAGVLTEIHVGAGEVVPVGAIVAVIGNAAGGETGARSDTAAPAIAPARSVALDPFHEVRTPTRNFGPARLANGTAVTPLARRLAAESGIDLTRVHGSGPHGRIRAGDVERAAAQRMPPVAPAGAIDRIKALYAARPYEEVPLDPMRRTIARRLVESTQTIPHFDLAIDIDVERLMDLRAEANRAAPVDRVGHPAFRLSINDFVIKAWALALQRVPAANAVWADDRILRFKHSDVGVAVAIDDGLLAPVIRQAEIKMLTAISAEMKELSTRARARHLKPSEYEGGSTSISNLGMYGVRAFSAVINPPQATMLAVGAIGRRPVETTDGGVRFAPQMTVTLSCDHRVVDGALGADLLAAFRGFIEQPVALLV
jgi:pyruvate dehydrogenase E2 component (dihydrolipoamide acetyltransferase)